MFLSSPSQGSNEHIDTFELTQVDDISQHLAVLDSRHQLQNEIEIGADSESSLSQESTYRDMARSKTYYDHLDEDEDDDMVHVYRQDNDNERLVPGDVERQDLETEDKHPEGSKKWTCILFLGLLLLGWMIWAVILSTLNPGASTGNQPKHIDLGDLFNSSFTPNYPSLEWVKHDPRDGVFTYQDKITRDILLESVEDGVSNVMVKATDLNIGGRLVQVDSYEMSEDRGYLLVRTNTTKQWRYSSRSNVYIYNMVHKTLAPLDISSTIGSTPRISYAAWSPLGHKIAYVLNNDLYINDLDITRRVTYDGSATVFNGVPDWVYEEEVLTNDYALWWSPDATHVAFLRFNETAVPDYHLQYYTMSNASYPDEVKIKYPKAGAPNPLVSLHLHSLTSNKTVVINEKKAVGQNAQTIVEPADFSPDDRLFTDVAWVTDTHTHLVYKQMNRVQTKQITVSVKINDSDLSRSTRSLVHSYDPQDGGWVDVQQNVVHVPTSAKGSGVRFVDVVDNDQGYSHLALFHIDKEATLKWLTTGEWEVISGSVVVDKERELIHYISTERASTERHLYSISFDGSEKTCRTCPENDDTHATYDVSFSARAQYYLLYYNGPDIPHSVVKKIDDPSFHLVLENNDGLRNLLREYELPRPRIFTLKTGDIEMNAMEILPPDFDPNKKYPVLFHVYGGPGSQMVSHDYDFGWQTFLASNLHYIVVRVDGRGTGFRGRAFRRGVHGRLGGLESIDQINAARHWADLEYVDSSRIAIWGWSFGGYLTSKVIETDSGVFSTGMAVAPVTDWRFYDSVYTERYMMTPGMNPTGYETSAVNNMTGFEHANFLLVHGTGDDNVHFQHSAVLVDKLTMANVHNYRVQFFPDSNHHMEHHNANPNVYYLLTEYLWESFGGKEYTHVWREMHGRFEGPLVGHH